MKIYFDSRWIGDHGIGRFARVIEQNFKLESVRVTGKPTSALDPIRLLFFSLLKTIKGDCLFSPGFNAPLFFCRKFIFTVHDLNHIDRPENSSFFKRLYYKIILKRACRKAFRILTVSEFSRRRISEWADVDLECIVNVGNGVDSSYNFNVKPYQPGYSYLLCVSNRKDHKNEPRILEAFSQAQTDQAIRLIFTGQENAAMLALCDQFKVSHRVVFLGRVAEEDLPGLYRGAIALVFPSLYEGFGLPLIEAMACGTPVLTSTTTCLPEIAGDAAILVDPLSVSQIADGIAELCSNATLRDDLREKGLLQGAKYSWNETVRKIDQVLKLI
ncbi:glycosyltransferase family 4 protein [Janthinobacterium sp. RB2R34]|uniref:glycosyltransferase family 4 protein n=1 Tax=Janthinobacterium sp. RB2R34 TaxID=3424193 RepID=UPI003F1F7F4D